MLSGSMEDLITLDGSTFFITDTRGDIAGEQAHGFFFDDTRHLSRWRLLVNGSPMRLLTARNLHYYAARIYGTLAESRVGVNPPVSVRRNRVIADGLREDVVVVNHSEQARELSVELEFGFDFADLFEVKDNRFAGVGRRWAERQSDGIVAWYEHEGFRRGTRIQVSSTGTLEEASIRFDLNLPARGRWQARIDVIPILGQDERPCRAGTEPAAIQSPRLPDSVQLWMADAPVLESDVDACRHTYRQSLLDLAALRFRPMPEMTWALPAAGVPWFMALFGRDSLISAFMALPFAPHLAHATLRCLGKLQAVSDDPFRDAEPGKILHELRRGRLTALGERPHSPYYGTHDATPLFLILLEEYERWTGDADLVRRLEPVARAALDWIRGPGDPDHDGYLEYRTRSSQGLVNQCWKDSWNSMLFADGTMAQPPIASAEIQGYAYDALVRSGRLAAELWNDPELAGELQGEAAALKRRFNRDFWSASRGHFVLALDGAKRQVDSLASNTGHLLWSGIVEEELSGAVARRLMAPDMHTGWGIRTMSAADAGYNPIEYHNGTVWPHDTAIVAEGLRRYGFHQEAAELAGELFEAASAFAYRLPEVFAGFDRSESQMAVEYPTASRPQAWAAAAPLLAVRTLLGLDVVEGKLSTGPHAQDAGLRLRRVPVRGMRVDVP